MTVLVPRTVDEFEQMLSAAPEATILSGGTDLMVEINLHGRRPNTVVSVSKLEELRHWTISDDRVVIGAAVPYAVMEHGELAAAVPALAEAARTVGSPQIRAAGTLGGNLGTCSPAGDGLPVLAALDATIHVRGNGTRRDVPFAEFMVGVKRNSLQPGEFVHSVSLHKNNGWQGYAKVGTRNAMVIATASACLVRDDVRGKVNVALGAVGPTIIRCTDAEQWISTTLAGQTSTRPPDSVIEEFGRRVASASRPIDDHRSTADYRRHAIGVLARRLLERSYQ